MHGLEEVGWRATTPSGAMVVAVLAALGLLGMTVVGVTMGVASGWIGSSWWSAAKYLAAQVTGLQWPGLMAWAAIAGALVATGMRRHAVAVPSAIRALVAGALIPVGLVLVAGALNHVWPGTTGPTDVPLFTLLLALYSIVMPLGLGRAMRRLPGTGS